MSEESAAKKPPVQVVIIFLLLLSLAGNAFLASMYMQTRNKLNQIEENPTADAQAELDEILNEVSSLITLPEGITPILATVNNADSLKERQAFFKDAQNGDKLLMYTTATEVADRKAYLFRPETKQLINVAPINVGGQIQAQEDEFSMDIRNGTETDGLEDQMESLLGRVFPNASVATKGIASGTYDQSMLVKVNASDEVANKVSQLFTNLTETFQPLVFLLIGTILLLISLLPKMKMWLYYRAVALGGLTFNAAYYLLSIATVEVQTLNFPRHLTAATVALLTITLLSVYNLFTQNKLNKQADQAEASIKLLLSAVIYFAAFSHQWQWIPLLISILLVIQVWINAKLTKQVGFLYLGVFGLFMTLFHLHETSIGLPGSVYPILCIAVSVFVYSLAKVQLPWLETKFKDHWLHSGVIAGVLTALFSFISSQFDPAVGWTGYRLSSLMTGYISLILIWDYFGRFDLKHRQVATGFAAVLLYSWQVILLGRVYPTWNWLENRQFYTLPFGLYFLWSAYIGVKNQFNLDTVALLDWLGIGSLIGLTLLQNLGAASGNPYALLAGAYSIGFVFWGNYTQKKLYQQVGGVGVALSVLIQSSDFILNLPRWLLVGVVGLSLIGLALWLLNKRGEKK